MKSDSVPLQHNFDNSKTYS